MQFHHIRGIVFDLDGTLLDTLTDLKSSVNAALSAYGFPERTTAEVRAFVGNGIAKLVERAIPDGTKNPCYAAVLAETRAQYRSRCRETTAPYDGILPMLDALQEKGYVLAVVSNKPEAQVKTLCDDFFPGKMAAAIGQLDGRALKPAPDAVYAAVSTMGLDLHDCVYVGDSDVDILTATNAGIPCISVLWGFRDRPLLESAGGTVFAGHPQEMIGMF